MVESQMEILPVLKYIRKITDHLDLQMIFVNSPEETSSIILSLLLNVKKLPISKWLVIIS